MLSSVESVRGAGHPASGFSGGLTVSGDALPHQVSCCGMRCAYSVQAGLPASITEGQMWCEGHILYLFLYLLYLLLCQFTSPLNT